MTCGGYVQLDHTRCPAEAHDRDLPDAPYNPPQAVAADGLMGCNDCGLPLFYCQADGQYHHVNPDAGCFLCPPWGDAIRDADDPAVMLREFMTMYGAVIPDIPTADVHPAVRDLRMDLLDGSRGEAGELRAAMLAGDLHGIAKEAADCLYVIWGTVLTYGLGEVMPTVFRAVHESNMTKDVARDAVPGDRKLIKGARYEPPRIAEILALAATEGAS